MAVLLLLGVVLPAAVVRLLLLVLLVVLVLLLVVLLLRVVLVLLLVVLLLRVVLVLLRLLLVVLWLAAVRVLRALSGLLPCPPLVPVQRVLGMPRFVACAPAVLSHETP
ncbi:hypothetical protein GCM10009730_24570 [Streptomyces albidochromogenes]